MPFKNLNWWRNAILIGPIVAYMVVGVAQAGMEGDQLINAGLVIGAAVVGALLILGGVNLPSDDTTLAATNVPTPESTYLDTIRRLEAENAQLRGQNNALLEIFRYLKLDVELVRD
ncbi:hypothetical protein G4Y79_05270 [Phototrophicus methaneseepsis]|uniref:Uncharacterized protein n=1 Tax=Phototrophicus methaneseepsis TaxID=2710758 RepID=A0A7S8IFN4_9CHLR|nr:hypothetical protein [Phototrophicus methaneseepsis]QPC83791.1 hypothetical protein G4Y79_05270 [Phototrophicus methaneseepsis]